MNKTYAAIAAAGLFALSTAAFAADDAAKIIAAKPDAPAAAASAGDVRKWDVVADKSSITFHGKQMGNDFDGVVTKFTPDVHFDENHLDQSKVTVDIDITSIDAKDPERNKNIKGADWFDTDRFPAARFETKTFAKTGDDAFTADGNLTIHGVTVPVKLPFKLEHQAASGGLDHVIMTGTVTLDRSKFQLGTGDWADPSVIANDVPVDVKLTATSAAVKASAEAATPEASKPATP